MREELLLVGIVRGAHGVKGEVAVEAYTEEERFKAGVNLICRSAYGEEETERKIISVRKTNKALLLLLSGIDDRDKAKAAYNTKLYVRRQDALELGENEFYTADLIDLEVRDEKYGDLGTITNLYFNGAYHVLVISQDRVKDILLPFTQDVLIDIDWDHNRMTVALPDGLYEIYR